MAKHPRKRRPLRLASALLLLAALAALFVRWSNTSLQTARFDPVFADLPEGFEGCRAVVLGDLHTAYFGEDNTELFDAVRAEAPDYIFFVGDLLDAFHDIPGGLRRREWPTASAPSPPPITSPATMSGPSAACRN